MRSHGPRCLAVCRPDDFPPYDYDAEPHHYGQPCPCPDCDDLPAELAALRDRLHARRARQMARDADRYVEAIDGARAMRASRPPFRTGRPHYDERAYGIPVWPRACYGEWPSDTRRWSRAR